MSRSGKKKIKKIGDLASKARIHKLDNGFFLYKEGSPLGSYHPDFTNFLVERNFNIELHRYRRNYDGSFDLTDHNTGTTYKLVPNISRTKTVFNSLNGFTLKAA